MMRYFPFAHDIADDRNFVRVSTSKTSDMSYIVSATCRVNPLFSDDRVEQSICRRALRVIIRRLGELDVTDM